MDNLVTVSNERGDVATYLYQDNKHTMFTFDSKSNTSFVDTLTFNADTNLYSFVSVSSEGVKVTQVYGYLGTFIIQAWTNTKNYIEAYGE